jgi:hypothetical protein
VGARVRWESCEGHLEGYCARGWVDLLGIIKVVGMIVTRVEMLGYITRYEATTRVARWEYGI